MPHLYGEDKIQHKVFSLCFSRKGGSMVLGAPEYFKHTGPILQTPIYSVQSQYVDFVIDGGDFHIANF